MRRRSMIRAPERHTDDDASSLRVAACVDVTRAEGPFERFALWLQGCTLACPGCCNPELWSREGGTHTSLTALHERIATARERHAIEGITLVGGEPLEQLDGVVALLERVRPLGVGVLVFTGYTWARASALPGFQRLWQQVDTLVDGPFVAAQRDRANTRRFIGSHNQRLHHRTDRYRADALWQGPPTVELTLAADGGLSAHGDPNIVAGMLRRLRAPSSR